MVPFISLKQSLLFPKATIKPSFIKKISRNHNKCLANHVTCGKNTGMVDKQARKTYFSHSDGGFHADKIISEVALHRQFLTTKNLVVNRATPMPL